MPCPAGVDIPGCFSAYNARYTDSWYQGMKTYLMCTSLKTNPTNASKCIKCGKCEQHCPQGISIRKELQQVKCSFMHPASASEAMRTFSSTCAASFIPDNTTVTSGWFHNQRSPHSAGLRFGFCRSKSLTAVFGKRHGTVFPRTVRTVADGSCRILSDAYAQRYCCLGTSQRIGDYRVDCNSAISIRRIKIVDAVLDGNPHLLLRFCLINACPFAGITQTSVA